MFLVKSYSFDEKNNYSKRGTAVVTRYLNSQKDTLRVENVENESKYQFMDIDLVWVYKKNGSEIVTYVEVKTDDYTTGNFWLETVSNEEKGTSGCFVKSKADLFFYYFPKWDRLYIMPMQKAQSWFTTNLQRFRESRTTTKDDFGAHQHTTVGRIVPIVVMLNEVKNIQVIENVSSTSSVTQKL